MRYFIFLAIATALVSCKSEPKKPVHLFADFYVRYLETEKQLKAHVAFYEGDTLETARSLTFDDGVTFQGYNMLPREVEKKVMRYVFNGEGTYDKSFQYKWKDLSGKDQQYHLEMSPIEDFSVIGELSHSKGFTLGLKGEPFKANESLVLMFTSEKNQTGMAEFKGPFDLTELQVPPVQLQDVGEGKNFLYLVKKQSNTGKMGNMDITSAIEFYSKTLEVEVVK